jgi:hypothetical protein
MIPKTKAIHGISSSRFSECKQIQNISISKKGLLTIFWEARGVLCTEFLTEGSMVISDRHYATLRLHKQRIHRIRPERDTFHFHQGKARPHCSAQTEDAMTSLKFTLVPQSLYSSELATSDIWSFPKLKETLKG